MNAFNVCPLAYKMMSVMANDSGMAMATITVPRIDCKKMRMTMAMSTSAWTISLRKPK